MKSIKTKLIIYFSILILASSLAIGLTSLLKASSTLTQEAENTLISLAVEVSRVAESRLETQKRTLEMLALRADIQSMDWAVQQTILKDQLQNTNFLDIGVVQPDGNANYTDGSTSQLGDRDYIKKALNGETNISDVLISKVTNEPVIMIAAPIKKEGKVVGVLIARRDGNALTEIVNDSGYGNIGYAYMINSKGTVVAHRDKDKVLNQYNPIAAAKEDESHQSTATLFEKILKEKKGVSKFTFEGNQGYAGYAPINNTDWTLVVTAAENEVLSAVSGLVTVNMIITVVIMLISIGATYLIGHSIASPIIKTIAHSERIANLDITQDVSASYLKKKDEIGDLSKALQKITVNLREVIHEMSISSEQLAASSEELTATSQQSATAAEEVAKTVEQIAKGASEQALNTEEGSLRAIRLGETIEKDHDHLVNLNAASTKVAGIVREGVDEIDNLSRITEESNVASKEIYDIILKTNESSDRIGQASNVIASIADQTNLLALNAAIEAARAGEAGKGFAVVADEIRKLAEQSSNSTKAIDEIVNELQNNVKSAVKTMERVSVITKEQTNRVIQSKDKYMLIAQAMEEAIEAAKKLDTSGEEMAQMKEQILSTLENLSAIAQENAAATQEASASVEEQTASMEEIAGSSESLADLAQSLQAIIMRFKV